MNDERHEPEESVPFTHRAYGDDGGDNPYVSPSGPAAQPSGPEHVHPPAAPPTYSSYPSAPSDPGYGPAYDPAYGTAPVPGHGYPGQRSHGGATTALVCGIISLVSALLTVFCCVTLPGILAGPVAIVAGLRARRQIDASPHVYGNRGAAVTGLVLGIVGTVLGVLMVLAVVLFFGWVYSYDSYAAPAGS